MFMLWCGGSYSYSNIDAGEEVYVDYGNEYQF